MRTSRSKMLIITMAASIIATLFVPFFGGNTSAAPVSPNYMVRLSGGQIQHSSPTLADINEDGKLEIIVGSTSIRTPRGGPTSYDRPAKLSVVTASGAILWEVTTRAPINSTPAVGDINGDGHVEIVVGIGGVAEDQDQHGGVFAFDRFGNELWHVDSMDVTEGGNGYKDGVYSSPAIGDINNDGIPEVVWGSWDHRAYAVRGTNGTLLPGWPVDLWDTIWSSPALADINRDGFLDVVIGADITANPNMNPPTYNGGRLHVLKYDGTELPGFPVYQDQVFWSAPAIADLDEDNWPDIVIGTGHNFPNKGFKLYAYRHDGSAVPGWPVSTSSYMFSSPLVVDLDGDGHLEVVSVAEDGKVFAFNRDGSIRWTTTLKDYRGVTGSRILQTSLIASDYNGDGQLELLINYFWEVAILDRNGNQLTNNGSNPTKPSYASEYSLFGTPSVSDIDGDGQLELVVAGSHKDFPDYGYVYIWKLGPAPSDHMWPMFRRNARHTGSMMASSLQTTQMSAMYYIRPGEKRSEALMVFDASGSGIDWSASSNQSWIKLSQSSGTTPSRIDATIDANLPVGIYSGQVTVTSPALTPRTISVSLVVSNNATNVHIPLIIRTYSGGW